MFLQRLWWLRAWWWLRSCFRLNPPSTVRSSSTWPSSLITSLYASQFLSPLLIHAPSYQHKMAIIYKYPCNHFVSGRKLQVPMARASILWLMGEYCERVPKIAPDVLRKMAKTFTAEEDIVKLQTVNLAAKLYLTNSKQVQNNSQRQELIEMDVKLASRW